MSEEHTAAKVAGALQGHTYQCSNCYWTGDILDEVKNTSERYDAWGVVGEGECPKCGVIVYEDDDKAPRWAQYVYADILRACGWKVEEPAK